MPWLKSCVRSKTMAWQIPILSDRLFEKFAVFIYGLCGIQLSISKKTMLTSRLVSRLRALSMDSFDDYYEYVTSAAGRVEQVDMIDAVSTNKTDFFREDDHFSFLTDFILSLRAKDKAGDGNPFHIWSAGCSSGEEPYTMGMVLSEYARVHPRFDFKIVATDISTRILDRARAGIYKDSKVAAIPKNLVRRYLLKGGGSNTGQHRIVPELQDKIDFKRVNFIDERFSLTTSFDVIFCRNVIIYFDRKTQNDLFKKFYHHLKSGGYFFLGHSEMMSEMVPGFEKIEPTVYRKL